MAWVQSLVNSPLPMNPVIGGQDSDGSIIYVGRAYCTGDLIPAKIIPQKSAAYVSYNGQELFVQNYEVLCGNDFMWVPSANGQIPIGALPGGRTASGETLYIGRTSCEGSLTPGKIHPTHQCLYIPYGGTERSFPQYEVLVQTPADESNCCCCCCC